MKNLLKQCVACKDDNHREVLYGCVQVQEPGREMYFTLISSTDGGCCPGKACSRMLLLHFHSLILYKISKIASRQRECTVCEIHELLKVAL